MAVLACYGEFSTAYDLKSNGFDDSEKPQILHLQEMFTTINIMANEESAVY
jgi:hypothetical protein